MFDSSQLMIEIIQQIYEKIPSSKSTSCAVKWSTLRLIPASSVSGLFPEAAQLLSKCLPTIKKLYGAKSVELANELQKYADVLVNAGDLDGALKTLEQAMAIMSLNYGDHCSANQEMQQLKMNIHEVMNIHWLMLNKHEATK